MISKEDFSTEMHFFGNQQVSSMSIRSRPSVNHYRVIVCLGLLAALLLVVDIGLGVHYSKLNGKTHFSTELHKRVDDYKSTIQSRDEAKKQLEEEFNQHQITKWELEREKTRNQENNNRIETLQDENAAIQSRLVSKEEDCKFCLPGWTYLNSVCYYFSDVLSKTAWQNGRSNCRRRGADLAIINSTEKQLSIGKFINDNRNLVLTVSETGFWIGLRDLLEEGTWQWLDGTILVEGYWDVGEPNNQNDEDCAAIYARDNIFHAWNDAPCRHSLRWLCEMEPKPSA